MQPEIQDVLDGRTGGCIVCGDCLAVLRTMPDECVDCVVTSPPSLVAFLALKPQLLPFIHNMLFHKSLCGTTPSLRIFRVLIASQGKNAICLDSLLNQVRAGSLNQSCCHFVRGPVDRHYLAALETVDALIHTRLCSKRATEGLLDEFKDWPAIHSDLHPLRVGRAMNVGSVSHPPCRLLDANVGFAVEDARYVRM